MSLNLAENIFEALLAFTRFEFLLNDFTDPLRDFDALLQNSSYHEDERFLQDLLQEIINAVCPGEEFNQNSYHIFDRLRDHWSVPQSPSSFSFASSSSSQNWFVRRTQAFRLKLKPLKKSETSELVIAMPPRAENLQPSKKPFLKRPGSFRCPIKDDEQTNSINIRRVKSFALSEKMGELKKNSSIRRKSSKIMSSLFRRKNQTPHFEEEGNKNINGISKSNSCKIESLEKKIAPCKSLKNVMNEQDRLKGIPNDARSTHSTNSSVCSIRIESGSSTSTSELDHETGLLLKGDQKLIRSPSFELPVNEKECRPKLHKIGEKLKNLVTTNDQHHFIQFRRLFCNLVPDGDELIMSFGCTYQAKPLDFPSHGRLYLTLTSLGFNCSLFGSEKRFVISLKNVTNVERDKPARLFSYGIKIKTKTETYYFNSLKSRDKAFTLIYRVWIMYASPEKIDKYEDEKFSNEFIDRDSTDGLVQLISKRPMPEVGLPDSEYPIPAGDTASEASGSGSITSSVHFSETEEPVACPCVEHKGRLLLDEEYPLSVEQMFILLFTENPWLKNFSESVRRSEMVYEPWRKGDGPAIRTRNYSYRMELTQSFGPKFTNINELQTCTEIGSSSEGYVITKDACNSGIPYADSFSVNCIYCLTRISTNTCRLRVHGGMVYKKSIFMGIKGKFSIRFRVTQPSIYDINCIEAYAVFDGKYDSRVLVSVPSIQITVKDVTRYVTPSGSSGILVV